MKRKSGSGLITVSLLGACSLLLSGCGLGATSATQQTPVTLLPQSQTGHITGSAHGGNNPVQGAFVTLWAAGTGSGYGAGATSIATTTTDTSGNFNLDVSGTTSACSSGQYNYITATGGNSGGGANSTLALMVALPQACNTTTGALYVDINEVSTVASIWALQQFMSITPANGPYTSTSSTAAAPWNIGAPSTNLVGLRNAFAEVGQLVNIATGLTGVNIVGSTVTVGSTPTSYYTLISPDSTRMYMLADVLATCINTSDTGSTISTTCSSLFGDVIPSGAVTPTDTMQAMYDIARAPGGITAYPVAGTSATIPAGTALNAPAGSCTTVGCTWALALCNDFVAGTSTPFTTSACVTGTSTVQSYPTDFALSVRWTAYDTSGLTYGVKQGDAAVDSNGNIWTGSTTAVAGTGSPVLEWDSQGHVLQTMGSSFTMPSTVVNVFPTTTGNVPSTTSLAFSYTTAPTVTIAAATAPVTAYGIAVDKSNNAFVSDFGGGLVGGAALTNSTGSSTVSFYPGLLLKIPTATVGSTSYSNSFADSVSSYSITTDVATFTTTNAFTVGQSVVLAGFGTSTFLDGQTVTVVSSTGTTFTAAFTHADVATTTEAGYAAVAPTVATSTAATAVPYITGATPAAIAIDSANNIWMDSEATTTSGHNLTLLTAASNYQNIYENYYQGTNTFEDIVIDGLNNYVWALSNNSSAAGKSVIRSSFTTATTSTTSTANGSLVVAGTNYGAGDTPTLFPRFGALDGSSNLWISEGGYGKGQIAYFNVPLTGFSPLPANDISSVIASVTSGAYTANTSTGGLTDPYAESIDGAGNLLVGNGNGATSGGFSEFTGTGIAISPTNSGTGMPAFGFNDYLGETQRAMAIDASGSVWAGSMDNTYAVHTVGIAAPVKTPLAAAVVPATATITAWSIDASGTNATFTVANTYAVGEKVALSGFATSTFFNGQTVLVTAVTGTTFTATVTGGTASTGATENGVASTSALGTRP